MKTRSELIPLSEAAAWDAAVDSVASAPAHRHSFVHAFSLSSDDPTYLFAHRDLAGRVVLICPVSVRGSPNECDAYSPFGFGGFGASGDFDSSIVQVWDEFAHEQEWVATYVFQNPLLHNSLLRSPLEAEVLSPSHDLFVLDLTRPLDKILGGMSQSRRREVRRWERSQAPITTDRSAIAAFIILTSTEFFASREASAIYHLSEHTWLSLVESEGVVVLGALDDDGEVAAASVFATSPTMVDYVFGISRRGSERFSAALIWEAMKHFRSLGLSVLNLGGGISPGDGVADFKRRFGAEVARSHVLARVHRPEEFQRLCTRFNVSADDSYFPPYRRRRRDA